MTKVKVVSSVTNKKLFNKVSLVLHSGIKSLIMYDIVHITKKDTKDNTTTAIISIKTLGTLETTSTSKFLEKLSASFNILEVKI